MGHSLVLETHFVGRIKFNFLRTDWFVIKLKENVFHLISNNWKKKHFDNYERFCLQLKI